MNNSGINSLPKVGTFHLNVDPFHVDFTGRITIGMLANHLLNCAGFHAKDRGFGITRLNEESYTWVLSRLVLEFEDLPTEYQYFTVNTWIENVLRLFTSRNFEIQNQLGKTIGYGRSIWAMINTETRKPADLLNINDGHISDWITDEKVNPIEGPSRLKVSSDTKVDSFKVKYSDIDINGHMNSVRYIENILNQFTLAFHGEHRIRRFEIAYIAECMYGDELDIYKDDGGDGVYQVEIRKSLNGEVVCRSKIAFS